MAQEQPISAYDLARDIAKEVSDDPRFVQADIFDDGPCGVIIEYELAPVIERMIAAALRNGGIRP